MPSMPHSGLGSAGRTNSHRTLHLFSQSISAPQIVHTSCSNSCFIRGMNILHLMRPVWPFSPTRCCHRIRPPVTLKRIASRDIRRKNSRARLGKFNLIPTCYIIVFLFPFPLSTSTLTIPLDNGCWSPVTPYHPILLSAPPPPTP